MNQNSSTVPGSSAGLFDSPGAQQGRRGALWLEGWGLLLIAMSGPMTLVDGLRLADLAAGVAVAVWLVWVVTARTAGISGLSRWGWRAGAGVGGVLAVAASIPGHVASRSLHLNGHVPDVVVNGVLAWLAVEVCHAHGLRLFNAFGPGCWRRGAGSGPAMWELTVLGYGACLLGTFCMNRATSAAVVLGLPLPRAGQLDTLGISGISDLLYGVLATALVEDVVVLAAVITLLTAARLPAWSIYAVVCGAAVVAHANVGLPAVGMATYAAVRVWGYLRYRRLAPLLLGHVLFDLCSGAAALGKLPVHVDLAVSALVSVLAGVVVMRAVERRMGGAA